MNEFEIFVCKNLHHPWDWMALNRNSKLTWEFWQDHMDKINSCILANESISYDVLKDYVTKFYNDNGWYWLSSNSNVPVEVFATRIIDENNMLIELETLFTKRWEQKMQQFEDYMVQEKIKYIKQKDLGDKFNMVKIDKEFMKIYKKAKKDIIVERTHEYQYELKQINMLSWHRLSMHKNLTREFIEAHKNKLDWQELSRNSGIDFNILIDNLHRIDWLYVSMNSNIPKSFYEKYKCRLNDNYFVFNPKFTEYKASDNNCYDRHMALANVNNKLSNRVYNNNENDVKFWFYIAVNPHLNFTEVEKQIFNKCTKENLVDDDEEGSSNDPKDPKTTKTSVTEDNTKTSVTEDKTNTKTKSKSKSKSKSKTKTKTKTDASVKDDKTDTDVSVKDDKTDTDTDKNVSYREHKIDWGRLCLNPNLEILQLLQNHIYQVDWRILSMNNFTY